MRFSSYSSQILELEYIILDELPNQQQSYVKAYVMSYTYNSDLATGHIIANKMYYNKTLARVTYQIPLPDWILSTSS